MRLTCYSKESIVLFFNKTNLSNTTFSYHSKLVITFFLLVFSINISFGNIQTNNKQASNYFSKQIKNYSKVLLTDVIVALGNDQQESKAVREWTTLYQELSSSPATINSRVAVGSDDAEEDIALDGINEGLVDIANADLELGVESEAQLVGLRFTNIAIPQGAKIVSAYVEFEGDEAGSGTTDLTIYGEATDDANTFSTTTKDISNRNKTTALVTWNNLPTWTVDSKYKTTNIAPIIQEIVDRDGWISGNDLAIMIEGTGKRTAESYNGEASAAPLLVVTYDETPITANLIRTYQQADNTSEFFSYDPDPTCSSADWEADWIKFSHPDGLQIDEYDDGSLIIQGTMVNIVDDCDRWDVYMRLENKRNWTDWTALGRMFYEASGGGACNANRFDWGFYEIDPNTSKWTGTEGYCNETKEVGMIHSPSDYSKGVQVGFGANNCGGCDCQTHDVRGWTELTGDLNLPCADFGLNLNGYEIGNSCSIINGGFEDDMDYWFTSHSNVNITNDAYVGNKAVIISGDDESIDKSWLPATPGNYYSVSVWGKLTGNPKWAGMNLKFYDKDRNQLANTSSEITSTSWSNIQVGGIAPSDAYFLNIGLYKDVDGGTVTFDEVCLEIIEDHAESACNAINNPNFETAIATDWSTWGTSTISQSTDSYEGTYAAEIGGGTEGGLSQGFNVIAGETYSFSAYVKQIGSIDWAGMGITWQDASGSDIGSVNTIDFTTTYTLRNIFAKAPTGAVTAQIWASKYGQDEVYIDGFCWKTVAERPSCDNLLTNEEFDNGTNDWQLNVDGSTAAGATWNIDNGNQLSGANSIFVNVTSATSSSWNIQLLQENKSIVAGKEYQVVFEAKATAPRAMVAAVQENSGDWDTYGSQTVSLTTEPQTYSFKFIAPVTNTGGIALIFHLAESTDNVFIDNVRFSEACVTEICDNNIDDDGDGLIDNADTDCSASVECTSCIGANLFDNPSFETGTWTGSETFVTGVFSTGSASNPVASWGYDSAEWVESNKATDGNRFVALKKDTGDPICFSQRYTYGDGNEINDCDTYQVCFDWASFNNDYVNGRNIYSQPSVDFIFRDNAQQKIKFVGIPVGIATANQDWDNLTWERLSFSFKFEGNLTIPANTAYIDVLISEREGYDNGLLLDNTSLCVVNSCTDACSVTNMYPGFALDMVGDNCNWLDYTLDNDLNYTNNGDGTATIAGKIVNGVDADWDGGSCTASPCGADDAWQLILNLSNKQSWAELQAAGGTANVHTNCSTDNLDYWDVNGTLTGLGCNVGRTLTINSAASNYRLQIGYGGNSNDENCEFGLSTWFNIEENGTAMQADIYAFLDVSCYEVEDVCTCFSTNLFDNAGFESGTFTGADEFLPGVSSDYLGWNWGTPSVLDGWSHGALHWIESPNSKEGDRMVYINNPSGGAVCQGQYYDIGSGLGQLAECATYQMCFDWASFNRENPSGRNITSQPAIDFVWFDADGNDLGVKHQILGVPVANQDWDNLIWSSVSFSFSLTGMYAPPANATQVRINISEHTGEDNGMLIDNANLCEITPCNEDCGNLQFDNIVVSNCIDQPLMDVATVDATISWTSAPANDTIEVSIDNKTEYIDVAGGVTSPQIIRFTIPADGSTANNITVNWRNTTGCNQSTTYDAPSACSSNEIACNILYICGDDKPHDGDAWDHGWLEYLDAVNGSNTLTPAFSKADASGMGLYDPHNVANALTITLEDYDLIIVSATTEERLSNDLINALKNTSTSVLNSNFKIVNDLGLTATEATYVFQDYMYTDNTTRETLYNFNNKINPSYGTVILKGDYSANADAYLWKETGNYNDATDGILFAYTSDDALPGVDATHGDRVFLGYHMNGNYANPDRSIPTPDSLWFNPAKHLTLAGKMYLDSAIILAAANCGSIPTNPDPNVCYLISDGAGDGYLTPDTFYTFNHTTGAVVAVGETGTLNIEAMAYDTVNQIIYAADDDDFGTINIATGVFTAITTDMGSLNGAAGNDNVNGLDGMTYDYANNLIWATERASGTDGLPDDMLLKIDPATGMPLPNGFGAGIGYLVIATNEHDLDDIAMAADGTLYAISNFGGSGNQRLGTINTTTGIFTEIGDYGIEDVESLTFTATGQLLATTGEDGNQANSLFSIDAATALATFIGSIEPGHDVEACVCSFGNLSNLQIGDKVWADLNNDGLQDVDEPGLKNVRVNLLDENGNAFLDNTNNPMTTSTDVNGIYNFAGLVAGNYIVEFELPTGTSFATKDAGGDDTKDSDADGTTGRTGIITISGSINNLDADAGILNANVVVRDCTNDGELFVLDEAGGVLLRYNSTTGVLIDTFIQGFIQPMEMIVGDDDYLYISDRGLQEIRRYSLITGAFIDVLARNLNSPVGMTFGTDGMLYVNNKNRDEVLKIDPSDGTITTFITEKLGGLDGNYGGIEFGLDGNLYVTSRNTDEVLRYNGTTGAFIDAFVTAGSGSLNGPDNLIFGSDGDLYVTSSYSDQVKRYNGTTGAFISDFVTYRSGGLRRPINVVFGSDGNIYVSGQDSPEGIYRYNESTGAFVDLFATGIDEPRGILFAPVPNCDNTTCCSQINYANNSLEEGNFSSFTSSSNPNGTATLTTFGGSAAVDWNPADGRGTNGSPITAFGANPGYWVDASTNGGLGALDGDRFYWLEPRSSAAGSDCIGAANGADLLGSFCAGDTLEICGYVAAYDPNNINSSSVSTDFKFEIYSNNGNDPADFITTPVGTTSTNDNGGDNESFTLPLPASTNILDITGAAFTGVNGQIADWRTLNWQSICFQVVLKEDQSNYRSIIFSMADNSDGMAVDNLSIRDITTPNAGKDTTVYTCSPRLNLRNAKSGETWSKVVEPTGATTTIDASTGVVTGLTENGIYKFLLSKTSDGTCHDTIKVQVNCTAEICDDGIDNDRDGLTDCEDPDCKSITITDLSFSDCVLTGSEYQATISIEVSWSNPPAGEGINVITPDNSQLIDIVGGATSPYIVQFVIAADNSTNPLTIAYTGGNNCGVDSYYDAPAPCPDGTERNRPCTNGSGYVGGVVFEDSNGDGLQDEGEPGLEGIMVTATDSIGATVGQTLTNNIGVFEFADLTDGDKFKLEFTAIPSGMYPTNGSTYKGTTVQYVDAPSCTTTLGLLNPVTNACEATNSTILQNGYSVVACLPAGDDVTLAIKDVTQLGTLWQTPANRNSNQYSNVPTVRMWETSDFEGEEIFSMAIDPRDGTIYAVASPLYGDGSNISSVLFEENIAPKVFKINPETGIVTRIAQLPGTLGLGTIDFDVINEQLLITNMDDGKIYRLNTDGVVLGNYDPLSLDDGVSSQLPAVGDRLLGISFNPIEKRVYYSVWSNHITHNITHENINNNYNTIRSVALDVNGDFISATDQLEITIPYNPVSATLFLTVPTADMAFNRAGDRLLLSELSMIEDNSTGQLSTSAHAGAVKEYQKIAGVWTLEPSYGSNSQGKYDIGSIVDYKGRNSRGGIDWAYERVSGDTIFGDDDFIIATGDALHVTSHDGDYIYGYQFTPATGGNIANSILVDLDNDLINPDKYVYSDVDIYKNYCAALTLEIGNYIWLDSDEDGVQDLYEVGLAGVNVTLFNAAGDSLTSVVTDADGAYYFNENISGFEGLTPNTTYYVVVGRGGQFNTTNGALSFVFDLTVPNTGDGNYTDENDSDGVIGNPSYGHPITIAGYPTIELTTGANGQNDYSFDFGFKEICSAAIAVNDSIPTCPGVEYEGSVSLNDSNYEDKTYSVISNPSRGTVTMGANGTFIYTGNTSTCLSDEFVYQVCDASNICCAYATVYLDFADAIIPTLQNIPDNDTISCDEVVPLPPQIFALDNCPGISLDVKEEDTQGEDGCSLYDYTITRTWTAIDICGNSTSSSQVIEVQDYIAPDIYRIYTLPNGKRMVAGVMELVGGNWKTVSLPIDFDTKPIILHQVTTNDGLTPVVAQIQNISVSQFELRIAAEEANTTKRARESVSWVAMEAGIQSTDYQFEMNSVLLSDAPQNVSFQNSFAATPALFTSAQTTNEEDPATVRHDILATSGMALKVQEEASNDAELAHLSERVGYLALEKIGDLRDEEGILLGEVGTTTLNGGWKTITLNNTYANPVIIANGLSSLDGEAATVRIQNVGLNSFEVKVEEWAYLDGVHGAETVSYMVIEGSIPLESPTYCDDGTDSLDIGVDFKAVDNCDVSVIINYTEKDTFINAAKIITRTWSAEDECGNSTSYSQEIICQGVSLQLKSILQGAMLNNTGNGLMRDDLRKKGILPLEEPYSKMPFFEHVNGGGGEIMDANLLAIDGADGIVDWVFVELRDANDMKNVVATQSALIQCDGDVVTVKGDSIILFTNTRVGDYFVALRHRNHLGLITLNTESFTPSTIPVVDFTFTFTPVVGSNPSIKVDNLESLWSGDLNSDGKVIYQGPNNDIFYMFLHVLQDEGNVDFLPNFISNRYTNDDFNLDGSVIYQGPNNDRAKLLFNTILRHPDNPQKFSNFIIYRGEGGN